MERAFDRRGFVKAAGATAAAVSALGVTATVRAEETASATDSWMPDAWDAEADAVIVGYGCAGPVAAIELASQGFTSLLIEKASKEFAGGDCSVCGGYILTGGGSADPLTTDGFICSTLNSVDEAYAEKVVPYINETPDYLVGIGVDVDTETLPGMAIARAEEGEPYGQALYRAITAAVESHSDMITVMYETPGIGLVQNPVTGEVYGVKAGSEDAPVYLKANRGVVVASGSYEADREMTNAIHMPGLLFPTIGSPYNTGDGIKMLMKAGCKTQNFGKCLEYATMAVKQASDEVGTGLVFPKSFGSESYIFVNREGKRFMNEESNIQHSKNDSLFQYNYFEGDLHSDITNTGYPNAPAFIVFDETLRTAGPIAGTNGNGNGWNIHGLYEWSADNQAEIDAGWIFKADTLEELAEKASVSDMWGNPVSIDPAGLAETVAQFNAACEAGDDDAFGRSFVAPLGSGPYYAAEIIPATLYATGGATHDINAQAIDWADRPIPRLYLAGLVGDPYNVHTPGLVGAVAWARIAAEQIAQIEPWE